MIFNQWLFKETISALGRCKCMSVLHVVVYMYECRGVPADIPNYPESSALWYQLAGEGP